MVINTLSIIAGLIAGIIIITLTDSLSKFIYPNPSDLDYSNIETIMRLVIDAPFGAKLLIPIAWALGSFAGGLISSLISKDYKIRVALITGFILMLAGLTTLISFPHPLWVWIVGLAVYLPFAYLGGRLGIKFKTKNLSNHIH